MASLSIRLPKELKAKVSRIARRRDVSRAAVAREALEAYTRTAISQVAHLKGCIKGLPPDLSTRNLRGWESFDGTTRKGV